MLEIVQGNIFDYPADGLVIPSNNQLGLGSGLREKAYTYFRSENLSQVCQSYMKKQNIPYLDDCQVVVTDIKHQNFKYLFHCVTPFRKHDQNTQRIDKLYENLFIEISKIPISSITLTSIGGGLAGWGLDEVLNSFCQAFSKHRQAIQNIKFNFVVFEKECYSFIKDYLTTTIGQFTIHESKVLSQPQVVQFRQNQINQSQTQQQQLQQQQQQQQQQQFNPTQSNIEKVENFDRGWRMNMDMENNFQEINPDYNLERGQIQVDQKLQAQDEQLKKSNGKQEMVQQQQNKNSSQFQSKQEFKSNKVDVDGFTEIQSKKQEYRGPTQFKQEQQQEEGKYYISLVFANDQNLRKTQNSIDDFIKQILEICKSIFYVHQQVLKGDFNKFYQQDGILLKYHVTKSQSEILEWVSPEMLESYYVSEQQDSYTLGQIMVFFLKAKIPLTQNDSDKMKEILSILEKLQSLETSSRLRIDQVMIKLISMINDEQQQMNWNELMNQINLFYQNKKNLETIRLMKIDYVKKYNFKKVESNQSSILVKNDQSDEDTVNSLLRNQIFQSDQKQSIITQNNQAIECLVIPVDKFNFQSSLPFQINLKKNIQLLFDQIIELAKKDKEHFLQEAKITIPEFQNESILFVFCPCSNEKGRKISLKECFQDIFHYAFKCLKVKSLCINHFDIFDKLIREKNGITVDQVDKVFQESLSFTETETLIRRDTKIKNYDWTILKMPIKQLTSKNLSVQIYYQDITQLKGVEAIVNTANENLSNGGGACGAIFRAADAQKLENEIYSQFSDKYGQKINVSEVFVTNSYNLQQNNGPKYILHAVGPYYSIINHQKCEQQLSNCIINILKECERLQIKSVAIPPISAGIFGYPAQKCAKVFKTILLQFPFKYPMQIHIVDILDDMINTFKFVFSGERIKDIIHGVVENLQDTECLIVPLDIKNIDSKFNKRIFYLAGESLKNDLQLKIENYVQDFSDNEIFVQTYHCQAFKLKFKQVYNVMFVTSPKKENLDQKEWFYYFDRILHEAFAKKKYTSITICLYLFILMILHVEEIPAFEQTRIIKIFNDVVETLKNKFYESGKLVKIGKIAIFSNASNFIEECRQIFQ